MIIKNLLFVSIAIAFLIGCSSKSKFQPPKVAKQLNYDARMSAALSDVSRDGATYKNGMVVTKKRGLLKTKIPRGFRFVYDSGREILVASEDGRVKVLRAGETRFEKTFAFAVASGAIKGKLLALVLSNNTVLLYDMKADKEIYTEALEPTFANDARLANPLFLNDLVIFPTLDGRLLVMDARRKTIVRDVAISDKELFNNVIFLQERNNILVAATASKIIVITPKQIYTKRIDIKDVIYDNQAIYIFTKTGKVLLLDLALKVHKEMKFPFAIFSAVMGTDKLYAVEKSGYLIEIDKNLENSKVYALPNEVNKPLFSFKNRLFFGQQFLKIK